MKNHPYPAFLVEAVAKALMKSSEGRDAFGAGGDWDAAGHTIKQEFLGHTETALQALWDASRVDTVEQLNNLPDDYYVMDARGYWIEKDLSDTTAWKDDDFPARIIYWGPSD